MKTELRLTPCNILIGALVVDLWHDGQLIGTITGADGPGVRIVTKFAVVVAPAAEMVTEVWIDPSELAGVKRKKWAGGCLT
jgi:hypothetical protein